MGWEQPDGTRRRPWASPIDLGNDGNVLKETIVLETLIIILVVLWLLGLVTSYTMGGLLHLLLVVAAVVIVVRVLQGRRVV
jgi:hypothetical protein